MELPIAAVTRTAPSGKQTFVADRNWLKPISLRRDQAFAVPLGIPRPHRWNEGGLESMTNALHSPVAKTRRTISCSNIPAFPIDRRRKMGKFILPIWLYATVTGVYFMLYQCFPSTHFDELKKRHEGEIEAANH